MEKYTLRSSGMTLPTASADRVGSRSSIHRHWLIAQLWAVLLGAGFITHQYGLLPSVCDLHFAVPHPPSQPVETYPEAPVCPWIPPLIPSNAALLTALYTELGSAAFFNYTALVHSGAVQIPTFTQDEMGPVGEDPAWKKFTKLHEYFEWTYPLVHHTLKRELVNTYGLLYTWQGSDLDLKPILLTGHQATVPVDEETRDQWVYPPFSGHFDGERVWGRGAIDDKATITSTFVALESLIAHGFTPKRTILLAFGFDEEAGGRRGAAHVASFLLTRYGSSSLAFVLDEGTGYLPELGAMYAMPSTAEKGYYDVRLTVQTRGGHSALPPPHTSIGILAALVAAIEENPAPSRLTRTNPLYETLQCIAEHSPGLEEDVRGLIKQSRTSDKALEGVAQWLRSGGLATEANPLAPNEVLMRTTQAVDLFHGGVKANQLPQLAWAVVNHRIHIESSMAEVEDHLIEVLTPHVERFNLSLSAFDRPIIADNAGTTGSLELVDPYGTARDPLMGTPSRGPVWELLSGTIQSVFARTDGFPHSQSTPDAVSEVVRRIHVAPIPAGGSTDAYHYQQLSANIHRYAHFRPEGMDGGHGLNEWMSISNMLGAVEFVMTLVLNADEAEL
ncbi:carboxypeptidase S [Calocera cornea HHB12733]|uniref:Carboxypeptidase S n=1 Tax=Calocera cornea HHB12733 TaxID=1353952 RepID=A0A165FGV8_9BASI|nr:carboxypeptidase S [Calocera cornea HHB12733]